MTWITDSNNNRASIERWGSEEAAREALATLTGCSDCFRCSGKKEQLPEIPKIENIHQKIYEAPRHKKKGE